MPRRQYRRVLVSWCPWYKMARGAGAVMYCGKNSGQKWVATGWYHNAVFGGGDRGTVEIFDTRDEWINFFYLQ